MSSVTQKQSEGVGGLRIPNDGATLSQYHMDHAFDDVGVVLLVENLLGETLDYRSG